MIKILLLLLLLPAFAEGQIITVYAGNDTAGNNGDGSLAIHAELYDPTGVAIDNTGNLYFTDGDFNIVRKVNTAGIINTIAGNGARGYAGDGGPAIDAMFNFPSGIAVDGSGNLYITDYGNNVVRKIDTSGIITTVAGDYMLGYGYSGDSGLATTARIYDPYAVAVDGIGNLYIADGGNNVVRKVDTSGIITTFAGNHSMGLGYTGDRGPATNAQLHFPQDVAIDNSGNVYIADRGNNVIRKVDTSGIITTYAGDSTGTAGYSGDGGPATASKLNTPWSVSINDSGNLYIADYENNVIRKVTSNGRISTVAGNGINGYTGNGGFATSAELKYPGGLAADAFGDFYIGDAYDYVVRKVDTSHIPLYAKNVNVKNCISFYPNPATTSITITANNTINRLTICNVLGQAVYTGLPNSGKLQLDISGLASGIYFVRVNNTETAKFVKE